MCCGPRIRYRHIDCARRALHETRQIVRHDNLLPGVPSRNVGDAPSWFRGVMLWILLNPSFIVACCLLKTHEFIMNFLCPLASSSSAVVASSPPFRYHTCLFVQHNRQRWRRRHAASSAAIAHVDCDIVVDFGSFSHRKIRASLFHQLLQLVHHR